jgi:hypothetical protein
MNVKKKESVEVKAGQYWTHHKNYSPLILNDLTINKKYLVADVDSYGVTIYANNNRLLFFPHRSDNNRIPAFCTLFTYFEENQSKHGDLSNLHEAHTHLITEQYDYINPEHYKSGEKETWERMVEIWGKEKAIAHFEMCAFKYLSRLGKKPTEPIHRDLEKAHWYLNKANELRQS